MGEQVRELFDWARRRKILAAVFVAFTLTVGILIGSVVSGRVSAMKSLGFSGTTATPLTVPDPIPPPVLLQELSIVWSRGREHRHDTSDGAQAEFKEAPLAALRSG